MPLKQLVNIETKEVVIEHDGTHPGFGGPWGNPELFEWIDAPSTRITTLAKEAAEREIRAGYALAHSTGFVTTVDIKMDATVADIAALSLGIDAEIDLGNTSVDVTDYDGTDHTMTIVEAHAIVAELRINAKNLRVRRRELLATLSTKTTAATASKVVWS